jgi:hypothetical protein
MATLPLIITALQRSEPRTGRPPDLGPGAWIGIVAVLVILTFLAIGIISGNV